MNSPLTLERIVNKLPEKFNPDQAKGLNAVFQFRISDAEPFFISIDDQNCQSSFGEHEDPNLVLHLDESTLIRVITGEQDGMSAYLKGQLRAEGNVMLATRLGKLFSR
ncbi:SCP2 sterol-binding domain-containing protein [Marinobacterium sediminicola]|uniref:Sterol carrier protein n=1 Tax=Marinobacterium sediminicola TaxID=518898 RepID=A0ABY1RX89_9GAMM|nr:SCP2 sterol-binding domain-containing protein [Marinobacterium sediminicola]ULG67866.1 SCP2 sterol-binding domain-containing protein [Marinobacterium sediminicola]SMR71433.1 Putative sterol carrier protein [Marinobacterium sediminicola]